jgi:hypothetical protein
MPEKATELRHKINKYRQLIPESKTDPALKKILLDEVGEYIRTGEPVPAILSSWYCDQFLPELEQKQVVSIQPKQPHGRPVTEKATIALEMHKRIKAGMGKAAAAREVIKVMSLPVDVRQVTNHYNQVSETAGDLDLLQSFSEFLAAQE